MTAVFDSPITTSDQSLDRVLAAGLPVALVFVDGARALDDTLYQLARRYAGKLLVVKVPAAGNPASLRRFQVSVSPAFVTVRPGAGVPFSQAESIGPRDLEQHVAYLLGEGPRPAERRSTAEASAPRAQRAGPQPPPAATASDRPLEVTDNSFEQAVLRSPLPVLIDFWAPWCGPCHMVAPTVERLAQEMVGRLRVAKINVDDNPHIGASYGVQSIPTMMIFNRGQLVDRWAGALPEPAIRQRLQRALGLG